MSDKISLMPHQHIHSWKMDNTPFSGIAIFDDVGTGKIINNRWVPDYHLNRRSQDINDKFLSTGNLYVYRSFLYKDKIKFPKKTYGFVSDNEKWVDIDSQEDLMLLNFYLTEKQNRKILLKP